ncbi:DUF262 domain-containing protein [Helicobacter suis]|uniref:DUF262 domain-containing protein n=5 Tax=Helicobacter suis TaxID=104628 RepID=E7G477_9HELI|nr:DUF262 domain-containing protein [Helicobacter suis]EFX41799.1 hypothetical protein HSUHS5_0776 [Helicobacter suis HS5]EFX42613.1 hypothetical protein HSUHS1_1099 [Helicobacter suis HS1]BCD45586.1 hypothetical protein NHP190020_06250 [Helicobacter suis]BCD49038.1 hypothetical protein NHP194004_04850 [Helicobacter suis]BCD50785.1 hypothetical protein NHP194022_04560 [Helicobacter suis]
MEERNKGFGLTCEIVSIANLCKMSLEIPKYQRPYEWELDDCEKLLEDIQQAFEINNAGGHYLGGVVVYPKNENADVFEVVDGQQRIITFNLLFRALYAYFQEQKDADNDYAKDFGKCLWHYENNKGLKYEQRHLKNVASMEKKDAREALEKILSKEAKLSYSKEMKNKLLCVKNYEYFKDRIKELYEEWNKKGKWESFCKFLLNSLCVSKTECNSKYTAMTIFRTHNTRGKQLDDAHILKSHLHEFYGNKSPEALEDFEKDWEEISEGFHADFNLNFLFTQCMHVFMAEQKDIQIVCLLSFFEEGKGKEYFDKKEEFMSFIKILARFWSTPEDYLNERALCYWRVLNEFPNKQWEHFVSCLLWKNRDAFKHAFGDFPEEEDSSDRIFKLLESGLYRLLRIIILHIKKPTELKTFLLKFNQTVFHTIPLVSVPKFPSLEDFCERLATQKPRPFLLLYAYIHNDFQAIPEKYTYMDKKRKKESPLEVEHIRAKCKPWGGQYVEHIGNKILLPKCLNAKARNGNFSQKQDIYKEAPSYLTEVLELGKAERYGAEWKEEYIQERSSRIYKGIRKFLYYDMYK